MKRPLKMAFITFAFSCRSNCEPCYLTYNTYGNWSFALALRGKKLLAFIFVGIAAAFQLLVFKQSRKIIS